MGFGTTVVATTPKAAEETPYVIEEKWLKKYPWLYIDPDEGAGQVECNDVIARFLTKFTGAGGVWSNWTERHATLFGVYLGYFFVKSSEDIPQVPAWCKNDAHYFLTGIFIGRQMAKNDALMGSVSSITGLLQNKTVLAIIAAAVASGAVIVPPAIRIAAAQFGITI